MSRSHLFFVIVFLLSWSCNKKVATFGKMVSESAANELSYNTSGKGETVVFIHAGGLNKRMWEEHSNKMTSFVQAIQNNDQSAMVSELKQLNAIGKEDRQLAKDIDNYVTAALENFIQTGNHLRIPKLEHIDPLSQLSALNLSTQIMYGSLDFDYIIENAKQLEKVLPNASLHAIEGAGHLISMEKSQQVNQLIRDFLND